MPGRKVRNKIIINSSLDKVNLIKSDDQKANGKQYRLGCEFIIFLVLIIRILLIVCRFELNFLIFGVLGFIL